MADIYNPWEHPTEPGSLGGEFATAALNGVDGDGSPYPETPENPMAQALAVIQQQSDVIRQLTAAMTGPVPAGTE